MAAAATIVVHLIYWFFIVSYGIGSEPVYGTHVCIRRTYIIQVLGLEYTRLYRGYDFIFRTSTPPPPSLLTDSRVPALTSRLSAPTQRAHA